MRKYIIISSMIWTLFLALLVGRHFLDSEKEQKLLALQMAKGFFDQVVISRTWNAAHGGVYVPVTADTRPNPYLQDPLRDIKVNENLELTKINPAFMTRQLAEISLKQKGLVFHITSLKPIRPQNRPTPLEKGLWPLSKRATRKSASMSNTN